MQNHWLIINRSPPSARREISTCSHLSLRRMIREREEGNALKQSQDTIDKYRRLVYCTDAGKGLSSAKIKHLRDAR